METDLRADGPRDSDPDGEGRLSESISSSFILVDDERSPPSRLPAAIESEKGEVRSQSQKPEALRTSAPRNAVSNDLPDGAHLFNRSTLAGPDLPATDSLGLSENPLVRISGRHLIDTHGRVLSLRGTSVSGISKLPWPKSRMGEMKVKGEGVKEVTFINRPFPIEEAHEHLSRLQSWGLTLVRLLVCWEALEGEGPGIIDHTYVDYLYTLISLFPKYGILCIIDAHQDVWSRFTGGSGAPGWTLDLVGFNRSDSLLKRIGVSTGECRNKEDYDDREEGTWPSGYQKLSCATMFTVFWGGDVWCWKRKVRVDEHATRFGGRWKDGEEVGLGTFLQQSLIEAYAVLAERLKGCEAVIGFEPMNEPHRGLISLHSLYGFNHMTDLHISSCPSLLQSLALASGHPQTVPHYIRSFPFPSRHATHKLLNPSGLSAWKEGHDCIWKEHGVWEWDAIKKEPVGLQSGFFDKDPRTGRELEWYEHFWWPFVREFRDRVVGRSGRKDWLTFVGTIPNEYCPPFLKELQPPNMVFAPHFYDLHSLFTKSYGNFTVDVQGLSRGMNPLFAIYLGRTQARKNYAKQISNIVVEGHKAVGDVPCVFGEFGLPMDMNKGEAFRQKGQGKTFWHERAMDALINAMEKNLVSFVLWDYEPCGTDEDGDFWNGENFSWYSLSAKRRPLLPSGLTGDIPEEVLNDGVRVLDAVQRPYAAKIAGLPLSTTFDMYSLRFSFTFRNRSSEEQAASPLPLTTTQTEIFLPGRRYKLDGLIVKVSDGTWTFDEKKSTLTYLHSETSPSHVHSIDISVTSPPRPPPVDIVWEWTNATSLLGGGGLAALLAVAAAVLAVASRA